ncbi:hypothetical protein Bca4012_043905 [Brassica carinata]
MANQHTRVSFKEIELRDSNGGLKPCLALTPRTDGSSIKPRRRDINGGDQRNSDYRRVLGAGHRRPSPETIRRPHTTTTADRQPYSNRNHNRRALRKSPKVPLDLAGWRMRRLTGPQAKTELRRHRTTSTPLQNDSLKARPPDLKRGALQPRSRAPTAGRGPDREK